MNGRRRVFYRSDIKEDLSYSIRRVDLFRLAAAEAKSFRTECAEIGKLLADQLAPMLRSVVRRAAASPSFYDRPVRRIVGEADEILFRALALARRCKRAGVRAAVRAASSAEFRKIDSSLDASLGDLRWLLSFYSDGGIFLGLPPIAIRNPILAWVWGCIAAVQMGSSASGRIEAAEILTILALDNDHYKKVIMAEGGVPPLLSLLRDGPSPEAQIAAVSALFTLASDEKNVSFIVKELAVPIIVFVLSDSPMRIQTRVAYLISRMATRLPVIAQDAFAYENAVFPLVSLLSFEVPLSKPGPSTNIQSLLREKSNPAARATAGSEKTRRNRAKLSREYHKHKREERKSESPEMKHNLKIACADALWKLSTGSVSNSLQITETKGLLCLSKLIEQESGELQHNCIMTVMEIAAAAESDDDLRRSAFKTKRTAAESVIDQLLKVAREGTSPALEIAAIRAIGSLARAFSASETRVLQPLVLQLGHANPDVAAEAAAALGKFSGPENYNCVRNSKAIIEFAGVPPLMTLLRPGEKTELPGLILLCYLSQHAAGSEALKSAKALETLETVRTELAWHPSIRYLLTRAIYHLELYRVGESRII